VIEHARADCDVDHAGDLGLELVEKTTRRAWLSRLKSLYWLSVAVSGIFERRPWTPSAFPAETTPGRSFAM
jgi:hypothetical protein